MLQNFVTFKCNISMERPPNDPLKVTTASIDCIKRDKA